MRSPALALLLLASGCASAHTTWRGELFRGKPPVIAVAPARALADVPGAVTDDAFFEGLFIGNILFSGGYTVVQDHGGMQNVSTNIAFEREEAYRETALGVLDRCIADALDHHHARWMPFADLGVDGTPAPRHDVIRGTVKGDGKDDQHLPHFELHPSPAPGIVAPEGADAVLVPWVVHYYTHNGGWFLGQTYGSGSGGRFRVLWALYDATTGQVLAWAEHEAQDLSHADFSPNSALIEDYRIAIEGAICSDVARRLP